MVVAMTTMRKTKVVIRQLSALEALGGVTNICSDKTGTLTQGQMITRKVWPPAVGTYTVKDAEEASDPTNGSVSFAPCSQDQVLSAKQKIGGGQRETRCLEIIRRPPHDNIRGVFTWQIIFDMTIYGVIMGACALLTFVHIVYGPGNGDLGFDCNRGYNDSCSVTLRARAAVFAELTWLILISAWEFKSLRRSTFSLDPDTAKNSTFPIFKDVYANKFLFWSVVIGALSVFPAVYTPGLNTKVFKHKGISWRVGFVARRSRDICAGSRDTEGNEKTLGVVRTGRGSSSRRFIEYREGAVYFHKEFS